MPKQTTQGTRSSRTAAKKPTSEKPSSRPVLYLEAIEGQDPGSLNKRFHREWLLLKRWIETDIHRIRAFSTANYDEQTKKMLKVRCEDAEEPLKKADVLAELIESLLVFVEDALYKAQEDVEQAEAKLKKSRSRKVNKRTA